LFDSVAWYNFKETYGKEMLESLDRTIVNHSEEKEFVINKLADFFKNSTPKEILAFANAEYPYMNRTAGMCMIFDEIIKESKEENAVKGKITRLAIA